MGGAGLGAVSSYSVKFQMSELVSGDFSQRQFVRSSVNLTSSDKIEARDCCFAYWFIFLLSHIFFESGIQAQLYSLRDCGSDSHAHSCSFVVTLILIYLPFSSCLNLCLVSGRCRFCFWYWGQVFSELTSRHVCAWTSWMGLAVQADLCKTD